MIYRELPQEGLPVTQAKDIKTALKLAREL